MKVEADHYTHKFHYLSPNELFFDRQQVYSPNYEEIDVYGSFWSFLFATLPQKSIAISINGVDFPVSGRIGLLIPPHSVVHWKINSPELHWFAYSNRLPFPETFPNEPTIYPLTVLPAEVSPAWIRHLIVSSENAQTLPCMSANPYAKKLKNRMDEEYKMNTPLQEYAEQLGLSKEWLIKYFKQSYGLPPIDYRNRKRLMEALFLLHVDKEKIIDLSHNMGFNDLKHFNALFKKAITLPPSQFLSR